jgi:hypothetical protein
MYPGCILAENLKRQVGIPCGVAPERNLMTEVADHPHAAGALDVAGGDGVPAGVQHAPQDTGFEPDPEAGNGELSANYVVRFGLADFDESRGQGMPPSSRSSSVLRSVEIMKSPIAN